MALLPPRFEHCFCLASELSRVLLEGGAPATLGSDISGGQRLEGSSVAGASTLHASLRLEWVAFSPKLPFGGGLVLATPHLQAHLTTRKSLSTTFKGLAGTFKGLAGTFKSLAGTFKSLAGAFKSLAGTFKGLAGTFKSLAGTFQGLVGSRKSLSTGIVRSQRS